MGSVTAAWAYLAKPDRGLQPNGDSGYASADAGAGDEGGGGISPAAIESGMGYAVAGIADTGLLVLVNGDHAIGAEPEAGTIVSAWPDIPVIATDVTLRSDVAEAMAIMVEGAREAGNGSLYLSSGYRDGERQGDIYDRAADKSFVQPPGHSEHQTGLSADIMVVGVTQEKMGESPEGRWLAANSWRYGFILRYPKDKQAITGISHEPWHFRYVGQPHAAYCHSKGVCLEEYLGILKDEGGYSMELEGRRYTVVYGRPDGDGVVWGPDPPNVSVSGDNLGGYVFTVWDWV